MIYGWRMVSLFELVYTSIACGPLSVSDVEELMHAARAKNSRLQITGVLLSSGREFLQILEGPEDHVRALFASIEADVRHDSVRTVFSGNITQRGFSAWSMAYRSCSEEEWTLLHHKAPAALDAPGAANPGKDIFALLGESLD